MKQGKYKIPPGLPQEAETIIKMALQREPSRRPTVEQILAHPWFIKLGICDSPSPIQVSTPSSARKRPALQRGHSHEAFTRSYNTPVGLQMKLPEGMKTISGKPQGRLN